MPCARSPQSSVRHSPYLALAAVVGLGVLAAPGGVPDAEARYHKYIGAFAYSDSTGAWGYSVNYTNTGDATERALKECRKHAGPAATDCVLVMGFGGNCAALAAVEKPGTGTDGKPKTIRLHFAATSEEREGAPAAVAEKCRKFEAQSAELQGFCTDLKVVKVACSDDRN